VKAAAQQSYNRLKVDTEDALVWRLKAAGLRPGAFEGRRVSIGFIWHEPDEKRDPDNIRGGAKLVMDALARRGKFIHCDGWHCVRGFDGDAFLSPQEPGYRGPGVELVVSIWSPIPTVDRGGHVASELQTAGVRLWLPGRLPDTNAMGAAREQGVRRMVWRQLRERGHGEA
jgi:hypothetical protein